ncbi:ATP-binding protein [Pacificispira sp.]|uniref:sensor histidine kinase n=1 Tax=Pacificispira sp. TaxID=2888761 RepID=UPI003B53036B
MHIIRRLIHRFMPGEEMSDHVGSGVNEFVRKRFLVQPLLICVVIFAIALGSIAYVTLFSARKLDESAQKVSQQLLATALQALSQDLAGRTLDYSGRDDLNKMVRTGIDANWAGQTIGKHLRTEYGHSGTYVLDPDLRTVFVYNADKRLPTDAQTFLGKHSKSIVEQIQSAPTDYRGVVTSFIGFGDRVFLISAAAIEPSKPATQEIAEAARPILLFHRELDRSIERGLAGLYDLGGLRFQTQVPSHDAFPIPARDGSAVAWATWEHPRPGDALIYQLLPAVVIATAVMLLASGTVYTMWFRSALAANTAKSAFFAKMTHELRTPLNAIIGFSEIMSKEMLGSLSVRYRQYAEDIFGSGQHLRQLIEDILDVSKMEAGSIELRESEVDIVQVLDDVSQLSLSDMGVPSTNAGQLKLKLRREIEPDLPKLKADGFRLRQVLINLLSNAAKHSDGGEITVRVLLESTGGIRIDVADKGRGIPAEDLDRVFSPFFQSGHNDMKTSRPGTGLGLSIARDLMRLHDGSLTLASEVGVGTTASMHFPKERTI